MHKPSFPKLVVLLSLVAVAACKTADGGASTGTRILQPGAPGQDTKTISTAQATDLSKVGATAADIKFMQGMIGHHMQAVEMVALINDRTNNPSMRLLGKRIQDMHRVTFANGSRSQRSPLIGRNRVLPEISYEVAVALVAGRKVVGAILQHEYMRVLRAA